MLDSEMEMLGSKQCCCKHLHAPRLDVHVITPLLMMTECHECSITNIVFIFISAPSSIGSQEMFSVASKGTHMTGGHVFRKSEYTAEYCTQGACQACALSDSGRLQA